MSLSKRHFCVLCETSAQLIPIKTIKHPYHYINNNGEYDMTYGYCSHCFSIQIMDLLDPNIIYDGKYNILPNFKTYNWIQHNISFVQFIVSSIETKQPLIEIGSSSFILGKHLIDYYPDFTVFDISLEGCNQIEDVQYIEGNCETYDFKENSNIIMSHVFEHLYEPKKFIANCAKNGVKNIIISIPNMNDDKILYTCSQHTFMYNDNDIECLFQTYDYKCCNKSFFVTKDESFPCLFFHFTLDTQDTSVVLRSIDKNRHLNSLQLLQNPIVVKQNTFIATAGMFSCTTYQLIENKENIVGFIDQNPKLHGSLFANTNIPIFSYDKLKEYDGDCNIIVYSPRKKDIVNCIQKVNPKINIICL